MHTISEPHCSIQLQQDLLFLTLWCSAWKLSLDISKHAFLRFSLSRRFATTYMYMYFINNQGIKAVKHHIDLGLWVTNNLTWSDICSSAYKSFHIICCSLSSNNPILKKSFISLASFVEDWLIVLKFENHGSQKILFA